MHWDTREKLLNFKVEVKLLEKKANQEVTQCKFDAFSFILTDRINIIDTFSVVFSKTVILVLVKVCYIKLSS